MSPPFCVLGLTFFLCTCCMASAQVLLGSSTPHERFPLPDNTETSKSIDRWDGVKTKGALQPELIGIGVQKGGTTSMHRYIHHLTFMEKPRTKELHFFDWGKGYKEMKKVTATIPVMSGKQGGDDGNDPDDDQNDDLDLLGMAASTASPGLFDLYERYLENWTNASSATICDVGTKTCAIDPEYRSIAFEFTPGYSANRYTPYALKYSLPHWDKVKLLLVLRDPSKRVYSGIFQTHDEMPLEEVDKVVLEEVNILRLCYNKALSLHHSLSCTGPLAQYKALHACVDDYVSHHGKLGPWFATSNPKKGYTDMLSPNLRSLYEGHVLRGIYIDQIINFLCAGFKPEQFIIVTSSELLNEHPRVVERLVKTLGREVDIIPGHEKVMGRVRHLNQRAKGRYGSSLAQKRLHDFFEPFNRQLFDLLRTHNFNVNMKYIEEEFLQTPNLPDEEDSNHQSQEARQEGEDIDGNDDGNDDDDDGDDDGDGES